MRAIFNLGGGEIILIITLVFLIWISRGEAGDFINFFMVWVLGLASWANPREKLLVNWMRRDSMQAKVWAEFMASLRPNY